MTLELALPYHLLKHKTELKSFLSDHQVAVVVLSKTFLKSGVYFICQDIRSFARIGLDCRVEE